MILRLWVIVATAISILFAFSTKNLFSRLRESYPDIFISNIPAQSLNKSQEIYWGLFLGIFLTIIYLLLWFFSPIAKDSIRKISPSNFLRAVLDKLSRWSLRAVQIFSGIAGIFVWIGVAKFIEPVNIELIILLLVFYWFLFTKLRTDFFRAIEFLSPLLCLRLAHLELQLSDNTILSFDMSVLGKIILFFVILLLFSLNFFQMKKSKNQLGLGTMAALVFFIAIRFPLASPLLDDDYHLGEMASPFQQIFQLGLHQFQEFISVHGWLAIIYGMINRIFWEGKLATFHIAKSVVAGICATALTIIFASSSGRKNSLLSLFLGVASAPPWDRFSLLIPSAQVLMLRQLFLRRPNLWFVVWLLATFLGLYFDPPSGLAISLAGLVGALYLFVWQGRRFSRYRCLGLFFLLAIVFIWEAHFLDLAKYILDNANGTQQSFGLTLMADHSPPILMKSKIHNHFTLGAIGLLFKAFKIYGWLFLIWFMGIYFLCSSRIRNFHTLVRKPQIWFLPALLIPLIPYLWGRAGYVGLDRSGSISLAVATVFLPAVLFPKIHFYLARPNIHRLCIIITFFFVIFVLKAFVVLRENESLLSLVIGRKKVSDDVVLVAPNTISCFPELGTQWIPRARNDEISAMNEFFLRIKKDNSFIDLTNKQVFYFISKKKVPQLYPSHVLAINESIQQKIINRIEVTSPSKALLVAPTKVYEIGSNMRGYRIFRHIFEKNPKLFSIKLNDTQIIYADLKQAFNPMDDAQLKTLQDLRDKSVPAEIHGIPIEWGRTWNLLRRRFSSPKYSEKNVVTERNALEFEDTIPNYSDNKRYDFLNITGIAGPFEGKIKISAANQQVVKEISFEGMSYRNLILPLGLDPLIHFLGTPVRVHVLIKIKPETMLDNVRGAFFRLVK